MRFADVVLIGAGEAGLSAAFHLLRRGFVAPTLVITTLVTRREPAQRRGRTAGAPGGATVN